MTAQHALEFLGRLPLFSDLSGIELAEVVQFARPCTFEAGRRLCRQGDRADGMFVVQQGRVRVTARLLGEEQVELSTIGPGEVVGELSLVDGGPRSATIHTLEPTSGYFITRHHFEVLRAGMRPAAFKIMRRVRGMLCARLRAVNAAIAALPPAPRTAMSFLGPALGVTPAPRPLSASSPLTLDLRLLAAIPFFAAFGRDLDQLLAPLSRWDCGRGHLFFVEATAASSAFVVVRGAIQAEVRRGDSSQSVAVLGPGKLFGHVALTDGGPRAATCFAREPATVLEISAQNFDALVGGASVASPTFIEAVNLSLVEAVRRGSRDLARLAAEVRHERISNRPVTITA